ncbi:MAG: hypothetical protein JSV10_04650 [Candidatus Zixiibacteriota bacterium]|nr:MAG: hypothetical protein JSV10_04650 [candidate division Zixibacteria bacterium]
MSCKNSASLSTKAVLVLVLGSSSLLAGCKTQEVQTNWSAEPVKVDGEMTEWTGGSTVYFEDIGVQLGIRNDDQDLYLLFRFSNQAWARAIRMGGVTLWLDNSGKKKKDFGIRYAGGPRLSELQEMGAHSRGGFRETLTPEQQQRLREMEDNAAGQITVIDKKSNQAITLPPDGSEGPAACFASPQGIYTYEFSIPLEKGDVFDYGIGAEPRQTITLGLEWGGISNEDRQKMMRGMPPGRGAGPPGGMGSGPGGGSRGGSPGMKPPKKQELWVKTQLASPDEG